MCLRKHTALRFIRWPEPVFLREHPALLGTSVSKKAHGVVFFQVVRNSVSKKAHSIENFQVVRTIFF